MSSMTRLGGLGRIFYSADITVAPRRRPQPGKIEPRANSNMDGFTTGENADRGNPEKPFSLLYAVRWIKIR